MNPFKKFVLAAATCAASAAVAADFPVRPVTIVVPYSAGQVDVFTRALAQGLSAEWGQPVVVDNKPGANEIVGADLVAHARPDGYTLLIATESAYMLNPILYKKLTYNPETQLAPVSIAVRAPLVFVSSAGTPFNTVKEFVDQAKKRRNDPIRYGSSGVGGVTHLPYVGLSKEYGIELIHVPYKGGAAVMQDLLAGQVDSALLGAGLVAQNVKAGKLKALGVSAPERVGALPDVPTLKEQGIADVNAAYILGVAAPAGTPAAVIERVAESVRKVVSAPAFKAANLDPMGFSAVGSSPKAFDDYLRQERPKAAQRVRDSGAQLEM